MKSSSVTTQIHCKSYQEVVLFFMLYKVVLTFESADENAKCDLSNESC